MWFSSFSPFSSTNLSFFFLLYSLTSHLVVFLFPHFSFSHLKEKREETSNNILLFFSFFSSPFEVLLTFKEIILIYLQDYRSIIIIVQRNTMHPLFRLHICFYFVLFALSSLFSSLYLLCARHRVDAGTCPCQIVHYNISLSSIPFWTLMYEQGKIFLF